MGVKSLWTLLMPVGRPVQLENVEGKVMAIDSSIWIYQFQATMRDKEGRGLVNAHVLGFLRRITKLLFYGIKPVFVFDGGAPALKRTTLNERKKKKSGAASSHVKLAEKLLAAQMRREALNHAQDTRAARTASKGKERAPLLDDNVVYLEDIDGSYSKTPVKPTPPTPSSSSKKNKFHDHDPYRLPDVDLEEAVHKATRSAAPDHRLATEDELRNFIEEMRPEDFDITSPAFRELPTEVQYEIIGDLRLKSRQTSYARLQKMLQTSRTPLDFSKQQIQNLRQRNALTQQLLTTTDSIGSAHIAIPIRIASERNKEYILVKNEGEDGGWILGIKDTGTREKPIVLDHEEEWKQGEDDDSDAEMEEVEVPIPAPPDPDLRKCQREMALSGIARRSVKSINRKTKPNLLFHFDEDDDVPISMEVDGSYDDEEDDLVAFAVQESMDQSKTKKPASTSRPSQLSTGSLSSPQTRENLSDEDFYVDKQPTRLETALSIANAGPSRSRSTPTQVVTSSLFGAPSLLSSIKKTPAPPKDLNGDLEEVPSRIPSVSSPVAREDSFLAYSAAVPEVKGDGADTKVETPEQPLHSTPATAIPPETSLQGSRSAESSPPPPGVIVEDVNPTSRTPSPLPLTDSDDDMEEIELPAVPESVQQKPRSLTISAQQSNLSEPSLQEHVPTDRLPASGSDGVIEDAEEMLFAWSRTPTPTPAREVFNSRLSSPTAREEEDWDAAQEMDVQAEEGEFARFVSQVKGRNMDEVRKEIDDEIKQLNHQRKAAMRDSEDITQQMIAQIMTMLRFFGIPYMTAPMEAEAQCAELVSLGLVDGVITDDSDVFLFGAQRVFKNMFNQSKTVECFLLSDLSRELGLERDTLIQLAYLLGSDYTEGLPGVGPVVAMELLKEFPGRNGLFKFKDWWTKVQSGKDTESDSQSKFRKQFKKKFKDLYLASDWPNSVVRDAYYHPAVDSSEEPFKWGMPDLDGLREFLHQELGWQRSKVDDLLLPIVQKMNKRQQTAALNRQGDLNHYLDISAGSGTHAPRQRQAYASKRLQQVISDFRVRQRSGSSTPAPSGSPNRDESKNGDSDASDIEPPTKKRKKSAVGQDSTKGKGRTQGTASQSKHGKASSRGGRKRRSTRKPSSEDDFLPSDDADGYAAEKPGLSTSVEGSRPRPKPRPICKAGNDAKASSHDTPQNVPNQQPNSEGRVALSSNIR
ncbi:hypothetical protein NLJ89_g1771 [Agrocybe chaxingu]|uniref:PIN domain-like protein n=1 Tax=Agrocybe chaxingu TaxID=84603 RepID=A0A9W8MZE8_9AGAR|nr:hypothetical protein NLJ89_g1771 [Agrocybe chaxingu]